MKKLIALTLATFLTPLHAADIDATELTSTTYLSGATNPPLKIEGEEGLLKDHLTGLTFPAGLILVYNTGDIDGGTAAYTVVKAGAWSRLKTDQKAHFTTCLAANNWAIVPKPGGSSGHYVYFGSSDPVEVLSITTSLHTATTVPTAAPATDESVIDLDTGTRWTIIPTSDAVAQAKLRINGKVATLSQHMHADLFPAGLAIYVDVASMYGLSSDPTSPDYFPTPYKVNSDSLASEKTNRQGADSLVEQALNAGNWFISPWGDGYRHMVFFGSTQKELVVNLLTQEQSGRGIVMPALGEGAPAPGH